MTTLKVLCQDGLETLVAKLKTYFVIAESGKSLTTNDYTNAEKSKLAGLSASAIDSIKVNGTAVAPVNKVVNIDLTAYATKSEISTVYKYKGNVATYSALPASGQATGDVYNVEAADSGHGVKAGDNVAWNGTAWDVLSGTVDLSGYVAAVNGKGLSTNDYTNAEKSKLAGIATGANNYSHPTTDGNKHVPANGTTNAGKVLMATSSAGVYEWAAIADPEAITTAEINALF